MKAIFSLCSLLASCAAYAQTGRIGIGTTTPQAQLHTTASVRHDTLGGTGNRVVYADAAGRLFTSATTFFTSNSYVSIPDNGCSAAIPAGGLSTINVSGLASVIQSSKIKVSVNLRHQYFLDVTLYLQSPTGQVLRLISGINGSGLGNAVFSDQGNAALSGSGLLKGQYSPTGGTTGLCGITPNITTFGAFGSGGSIIPNGTWTLRAYDGYSLDTGALHGWAISFDGNDPLAGEVIASGVVPRGGGGGLVSGTLFDAGGAIGIGVNAPHAPLQFANADQRRKLVLYEYVNNEHQFSGFGTDYSGSMFYQTPHNYADHVFYKANNANSSTELMRITSGGNVGIGNNLPHAPLHFANDFANRKLVLFESWYNDHQFMGFGVTSGQLRYQVPGPGDDHVFFSGNGSSASTELVRITGDGYVGIGTTLPGGKAKVEIQGGAWSTPAAYRYMNNNSDGNTTNGTPNYYSLYTSDRIWSNGEINVTSDLRTKEHISSSLPSADLALVNRLRVVDYNYVDRASKGDGRVKGFLAQEVEAVMPEAVMQNTGVIPNIYRKAGSVQHNEAASTLAVAMEAAHGLKAGDTVKLIVDGGEKLVPVLVVKDSLHFTVGEWTTSTDWAFVYGTQVHDLRNLDYNKIFSAGISAIQALSRELDEVKKANASLQSAVTRHDAQLREIIRRLPPVETAAR